MFIFWDIVEIFSETRVRLLVYSLCNVAFVCFQTCSAWTGACGARARCRCMTARWRGSTVLSSLIPRSTATIRLRTAVCLCCGTDTHARTSSSSPSTSNYTHCTKIESICGYNRPRRRTLDCTSACSGKHTLEMCEVSNLSDWSTGLKEVELVWFGHIIITLWKLNCLWVMFMLIWLVVHLDN